jgi:hypothetical protein
MVFIISGFHAEIFDHRDENHEQTSYDRHGGGLWYSQDSRWRWRRRKALNTAPLTTIQQITSEQKPLEETSALAATTPVQTLAQSNDKLLSEMKVYPSF